MGLEALLEVPAGGKGGIREMRIKEVNEVGNILVEGGGEGIILDIPINVGRP